MWITRIEEGKGNKYRVFSDESFLFSLYGKELKQFNIAVNTELSDVVIMTVLETVIYKRAKERALFLLERRPLSVHMIKQKLRENDYPPDVIDRVIVFLEKYHYVDDLEYTRMYVESYARRKSRKQLIFELRQKGISKDLLETYFDECEYSEDCSFVNQFYKYIKGKNLQDYKTKQKVFRYFYSKGFSPAIIEEYMRKQTLCI